MSGKALGLIEVYGYLTAVVALDSALKAANVNLLNVTKVKGGLVTVMVTGDVGAIKAAMDASSVAAKQVGKVVSCHVIPRPANGIVDMLLPILPKTETINEVIVQEEVEMEIEEELEIEDEKLEIIDLDAISQNELAGMTTAQLRAIVRQLDIESLRGRKVTYAKKGELLKAIIQHKNRSDG